MLERKFHSPKLFGFPIYYPINLILLTNFFVHVLQYFLRFGNDIRFENFFYSTLSLIPSFVLERGSYWQVLSYGFLHSPSGFPFHFLMNMYALFLFGRLLVPTLGNFHFTALYFISLIGGGLTVVITSYLKFLLNENISSLSTPTLGASAAIFGLILVFGVLFPNLEFTFFPIPIPIKAEYLAIVAILIGVALTYFFEVPISNEGHIGGAVFGGIYYLLFLRNTQIHKINYLA